IPAAQLRPHGRSGILGGEQRFELFERHPEELFQAHHLAQPLHLLLAVESMSARRSSRRLGQQADLLVVADRPGRGAHQLRHIADPERVRGRGAHARARSCAAGIGGDGWMRSAAAAPSLWPAVATAGACWGRNRQTTAPTREVIASAQSAVCILAMKGASFCSERPLARPENTAKRVDLGTVEVTIASTNAIESTAPVFCTSVRAPAAIPRRLAG